MTSAASRAALAALDTARPAFARLDRAISPEDLTPALADAWEGIEGVMRALVGASAASGTDLLREARQRQLLTFEQANALAALHAAYTRSRDASYRPSDADARTAQDAFRKLEMAVSGVPEATPPRPPAPPEDLTPPGMRSSPLSGPTIVPPPGARSQRLRPWMVVLGLLLVAGIAGGYWYSGRRDRAVTRAIEMYQRGMHDAALAEFTRAVQIDRAYALPHVYLARIAREANDLPKAQEELQAALTSEPGNELALREMGAYLLTMGNYELARKFYVRALDANPDDHTAEGFLGCTLIKLGRTDEGTRWIARAGEGSWTGCVPARPPLP